VPRDSVLRRLAHVPLGWRAMILHVRIRRYRCSGCGQVWRQDTTAAAAPRVKLSTQAVMWALRSVVIDRMSIARAAAGLGLSWHTVNDAVLATGHQLLIVGPTRFDGVQVRGVDEHAWRHTRRWTSSSPSLSTSPRSATARLLRQAIVPDGPGSAGLAENGAGPQAERDAGGMPGYRPRTL
jgi:hypothetical protein